MLPNRMQLSRVTEEQLKNLRHYTGLTPNISSRIAFYKSVETGFRYSVDINVKKLDGSLVLDKITWLGDTLLITELTLKMLYPQLNSKNYVNAWAAHIEDGIAGLRNVKSLAQFSNII